VVIGESVLSKTPSWQSRKPGGRGKSFAAKLFQFFLEQDAVAFFVLPFQLAWKNRIANTDFLKIRPSCAATSELFGPHSRTNLKQLVRTAVSAYIGACETSMRRYAPVS
jgi:hypothetical protein